MDAISAMSMDVRVGALVVLGNGSRRTSDSRLAGTRVMVISWSSALQALTGVGLSAKYVAVSWCPHGVGLPDEAPIEQAGGGRWDRPEKSNRPRVVCPGSLP